MIIQRKIEPNLGGLGLFHIVFLLQCQSKETSFRRRERIKWPTCDQVFDSDHDIVPLTEVNHWSTSFPLTLVKTITTTSDTSVLPDSSIAAVHFMYFCILCHSRVKLTISPDGLVFLKPSLHTSVVYIIKSLGGTWTRSPCSSHCDQLVIF